MKTKNSAKKSKVGLEIEKTNQKTVKLQGNATIRYVFTDWIHLHKSLEDAKSEIVLFLSTNCKYFVYQLEKCPETGKLHFQGYLELNEKLRMTEMNKMYPFKVRWDNAKGTQEDNDRYCGKNSSRIEGPWYFPPRYVVIKKEIQELRWWQSSLCEKLVKPKIDREMDWIWSNKGKTGKSTFATWLLDNKHHPISNKIMVFDETSCGDILFAYCGGKEGLKLIPKNKYQFPHVAIFDFPRSMEIKYDVLEKLSNGRFLSTKYESGCCRFNPPHIIVFANEAPDLTDTLISRDRLKITNIDEINEIEEKEEIDNNPLDYFEIDLN